MEEYIAHYESPIGTLQLTGNEVALFSVAFVEGKSDNIGYSNVINNAMQQLQEYFDGDRREFTIPLQLVGTEFQRKVWESSINIPYGQTRSYLDQACEMGNPKACRAVGAANGKNKLLIIVPCHRIIGSNGELTGYAGGMERKRWLLQHEKKFI